MTAADLSAPMNGRTTGDNLPNETARCGGGPEMQNL